MNHYEDEVDYRGGRVRRGHTSHTNGMSQLDAAVTLVGLLCSDSHDERVKAYEVAYEMVRKVSLPDGTWTVFSTYRSGWGGEDRKAIWSAHYTEEEAARWCEAWTLHWEIQGATDYDTQYAQMDGISPGYLRHSEADPDRCIRSGM